MSAFPEIDAATVTRYDRPGPRYTSYPTAPEWSDQFGRAEYAQKLVEAGRHAAEPLSLYFHIPFCRQMCTFCGCNVVIARDQSRADNYLECLSKEMEVVAALLGERRSFSQLHFGGGTPTFLSEPQLARLWAMIRKHFQPTPLAELAVEVNPLVTSASQLRLLRSFGFNRLSMGVQDFAPEVQQVIHRPQSFELTSTIVAEARRIGFRGINLDLIYGLPLQRPQTWQRTLEQVLKIRPDRLAVYSFAYVPKMKPHQRKLPQEAMPRGAAKLSLFRNAYNTFVTAGYRPIGMDHFALPEDELAIAQEARTLWRNFQGYTIRSATDVVAFGASSISDVGGAYAQNAHRLADYSASIASSRLATERGIVLSEDDRRRREVITDLMCNFWVDLGAEGAAYFAPELEELRELEDEGLLHIDGSEIQLTPLGRVFVRNVAMVFDAYLRAASGNGQRTFSMAV
ncbi:MAG TPA: oxygen-independent coproporphyrinogen III oxidase [Myxococcaceae bacterium]|nr:oxygen-independent coproporphyrinogen III oxidase [Myxococcaceae bacterium]